MLNNICNDIYNSFLLGIKANNRELFNKVFELTAYSIHNPITPSIIETIIELERKMMNSKGPHKQFIEEHIFAILSRGARYFCSAEKLDDEYLTLNKELIRKENDAEKKEKYIISLKLANLADEIFQFKMARDNFSNKRKALSLNILSTLSNYYNLPKSLDLCLFALKSKKKDLIFAALEFQENYIRKRETYLSSNIIKLLDKIILQTKDRSVAVGALNIQVTTGQIDEFEALSRIDEWKEKNDIW